MIQKWLLDIFTSTETEDGQDNILDSVSTLRYQYFEILIKPRIQLAAAEKWHLLQFVFQKYFIATRFESVELGYKQRQSRNSFYIYLLQQKQKTARTIYLIRFQH
ncbi:Hypothetical_protein [Hexamita inflata]|uniref:Hypothetical_protein n=1 Tax=Hexamita inflata TaxID=28002 RepID=A0AA86NF57_9EUKA|nr:Hypothetical protein HINF_LOCUS5586 [Hexamita inflata]